VRKLRGDLTAILRQAKGGLIIPGISNDQVLTNLGSPSQEKRRQRQPGALRGKIGTAPDFDILPSDVLAAMEGEEG
jgi:hypothetical protein